MTIVKIFKIASKSIVWRRLSQDRRIPTIAAMIPMQPTRDDKFAARRAELGEATLQTLATLGYARTSLREIAQNSEYSHGVLHYYFTDKLDLILCSVRQYKARCVTRYDHVTASATTLEELMEGFVTALGDTLRKEAQLHRLWYDLRAQSLFEPAFQSDVAAIDKSMEQMIWRILCRFSELSGSVVNAPPGAAYAMFDGLFQQCLQKHIAGDRRAVATMKSHVRLLVSNLLGLPATSERRQKQA